MSSEKKSYSRIMKSSSLIGGAQGVNMLIGMVRVKFVAILIGPVGVGLAGTYNATIQFMGMVAGLGLQSSAVRDIVESVASGDEEHVGRVVLTLRRMCWLTGGLGSLAVGLFSRKLSQVTFDSPDYALEISLVGVTILFANVKGGQMAVIQGMRRIGDLARLNIIGTIAGSAVSVGLYAWLGLKGVVPAIVLLGLIQLMASWWFARRISIQPVTMGWVESFRTAGGMVRLGLAFMWSGMLVAGVAYLTRVLIAREIDLLAVGIFTAAFNLSGMVVNFILGAMGADYYPSLTAINSDHERMRTLVNQQTEVGLLLALPGLLGLLALAPWIIRVFYSGDFGQAADLLQWFSLGCLGRVMSWPMGFILLAKGATRLFAFTQTILHVTHAGLILLFFNLVGLEGVAIAYPVLYGVSIFLHLFLSSRLIRYRWNSGVLKLLFVIMPVLFVTFIATKLLPLFPATTVGFFATAGTSIFCLRGLVVRLGTQHRICRIAVKIPVLNIFLPREKRAE